MRILFDTDHSFLPQRVGGSERSLFALAQGLRKKGHDIAISAGLMPYNLLGRRHRILRKVRRGKATWDVVSHIPVYRTWGDRAPRVHVLDHFKPDVVVVEGDFVFDRMAEFAASGAPSVGFLRHAQWHRLGELKGGQARSHFFANSAATARMYHERFGIEADVVWPVMSRRDYLVEPSPKHVTFVNPIELKGLSIALEIAARCPDIPFRFLVSWPLEEKDLADLKARISPMPNVTLLDSVADIRKVLRTTAFMLVPSQWFEAWGRVVTEAQFSGIPCVASDSGGLPEAVGDGGIVLPKDAEIDSWVRACRKLWDDVTLRQELGLLAVKQSEHPDLQFDNIIERFERLLAHPNISVRSAGGSERPETG